MLKKNKKIGKKKKVIYKYKNIEIQLLKDRPKRKKKNKM